MPLTPGTKLGHYEIQNAIGAGGMGEVYRARDTRLDRIVALKILPTHLADRADLRQRFDREARAISSLNHPNICALYDIGSQNGTDFLVMEYLEGEPLSALIERGPLPSQDVLRIAIQIADALDKAHRQGLVHRDLKPGNVVITKNGAKLLDFGLAKLREDGVIEGVSGITRSTPLTGQGSIIGTIQYMSPEQLEGKEADQRSDLFAFGVVLYEMATGKKAFEAGSQASLIAAILKEEPRPMSAVQPMTPPALERVVKQCLAKDPDDRWQTAGDLKRELGWIVQGGSQIGTPAPVAARRRRKLQLSWILTTISCLAALALAALVLTRKDPEVRVSRFVIPADASTLRMRWPRISPDGNTLAFVANDSTGKSMIWVRPMSSLTAIPLIGTDNVGRPFWSPDSRHLAFIVNQQLKKISATGGPVQLIGDVRGGFDGTWGSQDLILFDGSGTDSIRGIPATGGSIAGMTQIDRANGETSHAWPLFLPDGDHFIYVAIGDTTSNQNFRAKVGSLKTGESTYLFTTNSRIEYDPSGYLLYLLDRVLVARRFDISKLEVVGEPTPIAEDIPTDVAGGANFSVSNTGVLVYASGTTAQNSELVWLDRKGNEIGKVGKPDDYRGLKLSPDGKKLAVAINDQRRNQDDIWIHDLVRNVSSRFTFDQSNDEFPIWSPDGSKIAFASNRKNLLLSLYWKPSNGLGEETLIPIGGSVGATSDAFVAPSDWSQDGSMIMVSGRGSTGLDAGFVDLSNQNKINWMLADPGYNEFLPAISPDGRFVAYGSNESGLGSQVFVREIAGAGGKWQISTGRGGAPLWRADGKELYFIIGSEGIFAVPVSTTGGFEAGTPVKLFDVAMEFSGLGSRRYDVTADGQRFIVNRQQKAAAQVGFVAVLNWNKDLENR